MERDLRNKATNDGPMNRYRPRPRVPGGLDGPGDSGGKASKSWPSRDRVAGLASRSPTEMSASFSHEQHQAPRRPFVHKASKHQIWNMSQLRRLRNIQSRKLLANEVGARLIFATRRILYLARVRMRRFEMMADTTLSDGVTLSDGPSALASVTLSDGIALLEGSELDARAGDAGKLRRRERCGRGREPRRWDEPAVEK